MFKSGVWGWPWKLSWKSWPYKRSEHVSLEKLGTVGLGSSEMAVAQWPISQEDVFRDPFGLEFSCLCLT